MDNAVVCKVGTNNNWKTRGRTTRERGKEIRRRILLAKRECEGRMRAKIRRRADRNKMTVSEEIGLEKARFAGHVISMDVGRMARRVWETTAPRKKDRTEMG